MMKKGIIVLSMIIALASGNVCFADENSTMTDAKGKSYDYVLSDSKTYDTDDESEYDFGFNDTIEVDGVFYSLDHIEYDVVSAYDLEYGDQDVQEVITISESIPVTADELDDYVPDKKNILEGELVYSFSDVNFNESEENIISAEKNVQTEVLMNPITVYDYAATVTYTDEETGETFELPFVDYSVYEQGWFGGYQLYGTISDYDAATYQLGEQIIEHNDNTIQVSSNEEFDNILAQLGYGSGYRTVGFRYDGEPYTSLDGVVCRDYIVDVEIYGTIYNVHYADEIDLTEYTPVVTYTLSDKSKESLEALKSSYEVTAYGFYNIKPTNKENKLTVVQKVVIGFGILVGIVLIVALIIYILRGGRKKTEYMSNREAKDEFKDI